MEPLFSPDGHWLAYFAPKGGAGPSIGPWLLKKIAVNGGKAATLAELPGAPYGASWSNGTIVFAINIGGVAEIDAAPESGGALRTLLTLDAKEGQVTQPELLPDRKHVLFVSVLPGNPFNEGQIVVQALNGKERKTLVSGGTDPRMLPIGQLAYLHAGTLLTAPFDTRRLTVGDPVPLVERVAQTRNTSASQFAVSPGGTLAFSPTPPGASNQRVLVWVDREGHEEPISAKPRAYVFPRLSPDGTRIAVASTDEEDDVWVFDLAKETLTRLTFGPAFEVHPFWAPDNQNLLFSSGPRYPGTGSPADILRKAADGTGTAEAIAQSLRGGYPLSLSPDGKLLVFRSWLGAGLFVLPLKPKGEAHALLADARFSKYDCEISPDGRWIAYDSNESGRREIYVRPFPAVDSGRWQISSDGGKYPLWSRSGSQLFFLNAANRLTAVPVSGRSTSIQGGFAFGKPQLLFDAAAYDSELASRTFDISADDRRFLMVKYLSVKSAAKPSIVLILNWFDEVRAKISAQR